MSKTLNKKTRIYFLAALQVLIFPWVKLLGKAIATKSEIRIQPADLESSKKYVIAATHDNMFDPFIITGFFPPRVFIKLLPFRYFAHNGIMNGALGVAARAFGSFPASQNEKYDYGLKAAMSFMEKEQTVQIFPEGKRNKGRVLPARHGVSLLASLENVEVILVKITWIRTGIIPRCKLIIDKPTDCSKLNAEEILGKIRDLHFTT